MSDCDPGDAQPEDRPTIHVLVAHIAIPPDRWIRTEAINLLDVPWYQSHGWVVVMRDPFDMEKWEAWREQHPEATT